ncbi:MAG: HPr(Ser) kinase/phosphatase [Gammaproteobacteria bacterium]|nr:MAG: HPr(Ser) kinase/phosphatase [Gammaproteobacteria bacterium]
MPHSIRVRHLYDSLREKLQLELVAGKAGLERPLLDEDLDPASYIIAGPLTYIHPNRIQVIGRAEKAYLDAPERDHEEALRLLFGEHTRAVVLVDGVRPDADLIALADRQRVPLFATPLPDRLILDHLQYFAALNLSEKTTLHGVFMEVLGMGVLITGDPAVGKSELALELISRGNRLVADDAPEFTRIAPDIVSGNCPPLLRDFLEVRGLGILNIRAMFGDNAIKHNKYLRLIVHLQPMSDQELATMERLNAREERREVLGVLIPQVTIPVAPGRNLAILVEAAVRAHLLALQGYDATEVFIERQQQALLEDS